MKKSDRYLKIVEWSDEDQCYIGRAPGVMLGGVHGQDETEVYAELCTAVEEWIHIQEVDGDPLPPETANKTYSGKFNLRVGEALHQRLTVAALEANQSLNAFCVKALEKALGG